MSMVNQTLQRAPRLRFVIAGAIAAVLLGSSFYAAQAGSGTGYQGGEDSLSGAEVGAIVAGGIGAAVVIMDVMKDKDDDDDDASASKSKSAKAGNVEKIRVISSQNQLTSGDTATVQVQARYQGSKTWQNVTESATINSVGGLTRIDGSSNAFAVPYGSKVAAGPATIAATFGGQSASATVSVN
jgi:hypothetical protein